MTGGCHCGKIRVLRAQRHVKPVGHSARCRCIRSEARESKAQTHAFSKTVEHPLGKLQIRLMEEDDIREYLEDTVEEQHRIAVLTACLWPNEAAEDVVLPVAKDYRVVGVANVALTPDAVAEFASTTSLQVPPNSAYLSNMAVDKALRRKRLGAAMLQACIEIVKEYTELEHICLHVRTDNDGAISMYREVGFEIVNTDSFFAVLSGAREHLMKYTV